MESERFWAASLPEEEETEVDDAQPAAARPRRGRPTSVVEPYWDAVAISAGTVGFVLLVGLVAWLALRSGGGAAAVHPSPRPVAAPDRPGVYLVDKGPDRYSEDGAAAEGGASARVDQP